ncbi:isopentenyl-diphosphate Delta-isomerase [soil metagenome]
MMEMQERVILVQDDDTESGSIEKLEAHRRGVLHRAFSIFIMNPAGELLLQRRAAGKYHSAGLWSNSCCGHPRPGEGTHEAANRRLQEEFGFSCDLTHLFSFAYSAVLGEGLTEHEIDHVFVGWTSGEPAPDPQEIGEWRWLGIEQVRVWLEEEPEAFTAWFPDALGRLLDPPGGAGGE